MAGGGGNYGGYSHPNRLGGDDVNGKITCDCQDIYVDTILNSPHEEVLALLKKDDHLIVKEEDGKLLAFKDNKIAGSLTPPEQAKIITCIKQGYKYIAAVMEKNGASCRVQIKAEA